VKPDLDQIAAAVLACRAVFRLHGGPAETVHGQAPVGITAVHGEIVVGVVGCYPATVSEIAAQVRGAVAPYAPGVRVVVNVEDLHVPDDDDGPRPVPLRSVAVPLMLRYQRIGTTIIVVRAGGEIDAETTPVLRAGLLPELRRRRHVVLDLAGVTFLDSRGVQVLVEAHQISLLPDAATFHVTSAGGPRVARPLHLAGVSDVLLLWEQPAEHVTSILLGTNRF
jgi:anti-anti-sigma factor